VSQLSQLYSIGVATCPDCRDSQLVPFRLESVWGEALRTPITTACRWCQPAHFEMEAGSLLRRLRAELR